MAALTASHALGLSIFASYFLFILFLFYTIISSIRRHAKAGAAPLRALVFGALALASFAHTWFWMFRFMAWSFQGYEAALEQRDVRPIVRVASWLRDTALFEQAWSAVCAGPFNWWWSEQLCLFTAGAFTVFLYLQRDRVPHVWAYMLLGQVVAISVALALLNLALALIPRPPAARTDRRLPPALTVPVVLSMLTISLAPYTSRATFLPNLLAMHALLVLPLAPLPLPAAPRRLRARAASFCTLLALLALLLRARTTLAALAALRITASPFFSPRYPAAAARALWGAPAALHARAWAALHAHPAQASIGWDVVWTAAVWLARAPGPVRALQAAFAGVGVVAPLDLARALRDDGARERPAAAAAKTE